MNDKPDASKLPNVARHMARARDNLTELLSCVCKIEQELSRSAPSYESLDALEDSCETLLSRLGGHVAAAVYLAKGGK